MNCPRCNRPNAPGAAFCENCGVALAEAPAPKRSTQAEGELWKPPAGSRRVTMFEPSSAPAEPVPQVRDPFAPALATGSAPPAPRDPFGAAVQPAPATTASKRATVYSSDPFAAALSNAASDRRLIGWVVTFDGDANGLSFPLREGRNVIGRDSGSDILLSDARVSGKHACIQHRSGRTWVYDENSNNGTFLNDEDIFQERPALNDGDVLRVGGVTFLVKLIPPDAFERLWSKSKERA